MSTSTDLVIIPELESSKDLAVLDPQRQLTLKETFLPFFVDFKALAEEAKTIAVNQPAAAKVMRLKLRKVRTACDKARAQAGADALLYKKSVDGLYKLLESNLEPLETRMDNIEKAEQIAIAEKAAALKAARLAELTPLAMVTSTSLDFYDLAGMPESQYLALLKSTREAAEAKLAQTKKAEEDRIAAEAARVKREADLAIENARLAKEAADKQAALDEANRKAEADRKAAVAQVAKAKAEADAKLAAQTKLAADEAAKVKKANDDRLAQERAQREAYDAKVAADRQAREAQEKARADQAAKEKAALEAKLAKERDAATKVAAELKAKQDAEANKLAQEKAAQAKAAAAPDKIKLGEFANTIRSLGVPVLKTNEALAAKIRDQVVKFAIWVDLEANKL